MTKYTESDKYDIEKIDNITEFMKFNTDLGSKVDHLVDIYKNAHHIDKIIWMGIIEHLFQ